MKNIYVLVWPEMFSWTIYSFCFHIKRNIKILYKKANDFSNAAMEKLKDLLYPYKLLNTNYKLSWNSLCSRWNKVTLYSWILVYHDIQALKRILKKEENAVNKRNERRLEGGYKSFSRDPSFRSQIQPQAPSTFFLPPFASPRIYFVVFLVMMLYVFGVDSSTYRGRSKLKIFVYCWITLFFVHILRFKQIFIFSAFQSNFYIKWP